MTTRRTFLVAGIAGGVALAAAGWLRWGRRPSHEVGVGASWTGLDPQAPAIVAAIVPAMLAGALPSAAAERQRAIADTVANVERAIAGLPDAARRELAQLFSLLAFAPARIALAGVGERWEDAPPQAVAVFLARWRDSRFLLLRSAYDALHQLVLAARYGNPRSWPAIGYPGPPALS